MTQLDIPNSGKVYRGTWAEILAHSNEIPQASEVEVKVFTSVPDIDAKLRQWQQQDNTALVLDVPTQTLFAQWAQEDAEMTNAEREAEDCLWQDIEQGLTENSGLRLRHLGE